MASEKKYTITRTYPHQIMATEMTARQVFEWAEKNNRCDDWSIEMRGGKFFCAFGAEEMRECSISTLVAHDFTVAEDGA